MSKKDGSLISLLNFHFPKRYSSRILQKEGRNERAIQMYFPSNVHYGHDFMIADISSDTLYMLTQNKKITPVLVRKPSVHASEPRKVWTTLLTTDKFMIIGAVVLDFNSKGGKFPAWIYEFKTGKIYKEDISDSESERGALNYNSSPAIAKNMTAQLVQAPSIINAYKRKKLEGKVEKFIKTLREDDNPVLRIIKFK